MEKISVIIPTYNNSAVLQNFFDHLKKQTYKNVEYVVSDGGSTDDTVKIAKRNNARIVNNEKKLAEPGVRVGMKNAKGELLIVMAIDNFFYDKNAFRKIVKVFKDENIVAGFPKQESLKKDNLFTKYRNTFSDPISHFLYGYATNGRTYHKYYKNKYKGNGYDVFDFKSRDVFPLIAYAQGFVIRKKYISMQGVYDDVKPIYDLVENGYNIAYIYSVDVYHHTYKGMFDFMRKIRWPTRNYLEKKDMGLRTRANYLSPSSKYLVYLWPFYSLSIIFPVLRSIYGLIDEKESMWLFHPVICFISGIAMLQETIYYLVSNKLK